MSILQKLSFFLRNRLLDVILQQINACPEDKWGFPFYREPPLGAEKKSRTPALPSLYAAQASQLITDLIGDIAREYEACHEHEKAKSIYQQIVQNHPGDQYAAKAQLDIQKTDICSLIDVKNDISVETETDRLITDFSGNSYLPETLFDIGKKYESLWKYQQAKSVYQQIASQFPSSTHAARATLEAAKMDVFFLIYVGNYAAVDAAINQFVSDFSSSSYFPRSFYGIAARYEKAAQYEKAKSLYLQIIQQHQGSEYADKAQLDVERINVSADSGEGSDTQAAIDSLITEHAGSSYSAETLYSIAKRYEGEGEDAQAQDVYQKVINNHSSSLYAVKAQLDIPRMNIESLISTDDDAAAQTMIDSLITDFGGSAHLPEALYKIGKRWEWSKKNDDAKGLYQRLSQQCPNSPQALNAPIDIRRIDIETLIDSGQDIAVQAEIDSLIIDFPGNEYLSEVLCEVAGRYEWSQKKYDKAKNIYQKLVLDFPDSSFSAKAKLGIRKIDVLAFIDLCDHVGAKAAIDSLKADFISSLYLPDAKFWLAEQYYVKAFQLQKESSHIQAAECFQAAAEIWESVINEFPGFRLAPDAYCWVGDCYNKLGQYEKSIEYYQKLFEDHSLYHMGWHARLMIGRNYQSLKKAGLISSSQADAGTRTAYQQLLDNWPNCKAAGTASYWLSSHN